MEFVDAVHLSHIHETNQRCLEPAIFGFEWFQLFKMTVNKGMICRKKKKMPEKSYVSVPRRLYFPALQ